MSTLPHTETTFDDILDINPEEQREKFMGAIKHHYKTKGKNKTTQAEQKNIMLIGRTRAGKSTIRTLLVDPTVVPQELTLKSGTKDPIFESFHVAEKETVLNIIDTPGLFERGPTADVIRDNPAILKTIKVCVTREITKFHFICFCVSITSGINQQDMEALELLIKFLGEDLSRNSCLIVTHCELKTEAQREDMRKQLLEDSHFQKIAPFFEQGIYFSGSINRDDYNQGNDSIVRQYKIIDGYRGTLIDLFTSDIEPFQINQTLIESILNSDAEHVRAHEELRKINQERTNIMEQLNGAIPGESSQVRGLMKDLKSKDKQLSDQLENMKVNEPINNCNTQ